MPQRIRYRHVSLPVKVSFLNRVIYNKWATQIITTGDCISKPLINDLKINPEKVHTIPTGVDPPADLIDREKARIRLCQELTLPTHCRFIGQVSVLRNWKGQDDVMEGFDQVADDWPDVHLVFVGGGHGERYLPPIAKSKKHADRIHFVGHQSDPWPYFRALDVNLLASIAGEGIPQVGMQSMLSGTPFIGTKVGGIPEIVTDGKTGLLVEPKNPKQIGEALRRCFNEDGLMAHLSVEALKWARENCSIALMGSRVAEVFERQ